jgi:hypothetical protein
MPIDQRMGMGIDNTLWPAGKEVVALNYSNVVPSLQPRVMTSLPPRGTRSPDCWPKVVVVNIIRVCRRRHKRFEKKAVLARCVMLGMLRFP